MSDLEVKGSAVGSAAKPADLPHPDSKVVFERAKSVTIGVLVVTVGVLTFAQFAKPVRPADQDASSVTLAPRSPM